MMIMNFFFLQNQCRNLTFHPGKYIRIETCQALFTITKNLGYFLTLDFKGNVSSLLPVHNLLLIISKEFKQAVIFKLQISSNSIVYLVVQINQPCLKKNEILLSQEFSGSIAVGMFIEQAVEIVDFEKQLIAIATQLVISKIDTYYIYIIISMCHFLCIQNAFILTRIKYIRPNISPDVHYKNALITRQQKIDKYRELFEYPNV